MARGPTYRTNYLERIKIFYEFLIENGEECQKNLKVISSQADTSSSNVSSLQKKLDHYKESAKEFSEDFPEVLEED